MSKIALLLAAGGGYVLGARAGRERYEQIQAQAGRLWRDPRVQKAKGQARDAAAEAGVQAKDKVAEKVSEKTRNHAATSGTSTSAPTPNDMPEHPAAPGTADEGGSGSSIS